MRVKGEAFASNDAPVVDCTLAGITVDPEAEGLCGVDNCFAAPCVPLPVAPEILVLLAPVELKLLPLLTGTFIPTPLIFLPTVPEAEELDNFEGA